MKNYRVQDSCVNCQHCYHWSDMDCQSILYCTKNQPPRPISDIEIRDLPYQYPFFSKAQEDAWEEWYKWATKEKMVDEPGQCDHWEKRK